MSKSLGNFRLRQGFLAQLMHRLFTRINFSNMAMALYRIVVGIENDLSRTMMMVNKLG